jgi:hypothetical protein
VRLAELILKLVERHDERNRKTSEQARSAVSTGDS